MKEKIIKEVLELVDMSLNKLYEKDKYLIQNNSTERNIVFHFSRYFSNFFDKKYTKIYDELSVDCEYDRDDSDKKKILDDNKNEKNIYPDFILHKRGKNSNKNILVIEFKMYDNTDQGELQRDIIKLKKLTDPNANFKYKLGLHIIIGKEREEVKIVKYVDGKKVENKEDQIF